MLPSIEKLEILGAKIIDTREITSLYFVRYGSNEQCYMYNEKEIRVSDLVGYPVFISEKAI